MDIYEIRQALSTGRSIYDLPLRVTYYARVSTDKDEQLHSLSAQMAYYCDFIQNNPNWIYIEGYVDEGISGTSVGKREHFLQMIRDAEKKQFDFVVTKEISRFSRNTLDSIQYTQQLLRCGVGVLFQSDNINTLMPDAELRLTIMSSIAQDEVRKTSERVKFGFKRAIENGVVLGSNRIWGYRKQEGRLIIDEDEADIVRLIFDLYANQKMGIRAVANYLTDHGYTNTNGNAFSFSTIRGILCNPKYKGWYCGGKSSKIDYKLNMVKQFAQEDWIMYKDDSAVPPIVSEALWDKANQLLTQRSAKQSSQDKSSYQNKYPYSGKIICGTHNTPYYRSVYHYKYSEKEVWLCRKYSQKGKCGCESPLLYTQELNWITYDCLLNLLPDHPELISDMEKLYSDAAGRDESHKKITEKQAQITNLLRRKDKLLDLNICGDISNQEFHLRNERFNAEILAVQNDIRLLQNNLLQAELLRDPKSLQPALEDELAFSNGFSVGIIHALYDHISVGAGDCGSIRLSAYLKAVGTPYVYEIRRKRGAPSVCTRKYI